MCTITGTRCSAADEGDFRRIISCDHPVGLEKPDRQERNIVYFSYTAWQYTERVNKPSIDLVPCILIEEQFQSGLFEPGNVKIRLIEYKMISI